MLYHYSENFILAISHDEVVHGKQSLISKMWGDNWNKYSGLRLYALYMMGHPGKKHLFMGCEFGQFVEWQSDQQLQWHVIGQYLCHQETHHFFKQLNHLYIDHPALWQLDHLQDGFEWLDSNNNQQSILSFIRYIIDRK
jgi:1,4-alpha-glucan branching enzyme